MWDYYDCDMFTSCLLHLASIFGCRLPQIHGNSALRARPLICYLKTGRFESKADENLEPTILFYTILIIWGVFKKMFVVFSVYKKIRFSLETAINFNLSRKH